MELDPNTAITKCDAGMDEFKPIPNLSQFPELEVVKGRLLRARKASEQMRSRQTAQRDFDAMNIEISGVMAMKKNSQAIINGEIAHKGTMVKASSDSADVMVDEILAGARDVRVPRLQNDAVAVRGRPEEIGDKRRFL